MEDKPTVPLPADPAEAGRKRTIVIAVGAVIAVAVAVVSVVAVTGGSSSPHKPVLSAAAATGSSTDATDTGGYSPPPGFTYSARPGQPSAPASTPPSSPSSAPVADPPPSGPGSSPPASNPAPPAKTVTKAPASSPASAAPPPSTSKYQISGTISCVSGKSVEGVWVQAAQGSGYSPWQGIGDGSTSRYWYTLPSKESFSLHVGCDGTPAAWKVSLATPLASGPVANFTCHDIENQAEYGACDLQ